jgi:hypothetical protein
MNIQTQQIYYLLSQNGHENSNHGEIMSNYKFVDPSHMDNLFEVIQIDNLTYKIIKIYKNNNLHDKFIVNDIIYFGEGMISFYTKNNEGEIDKCECFTTVLIEKEKITLFNELIDTKIDELLDLITELDTKYNGCVIDPKYHDIKNTLNLFSNAFIYLIRECIPKLF